MTQPQDITRLLIAARIGDRTAADGLFRQLYDALRGMAHQRLAQPGAWRSSGNAGPVNATWLGLIDQSRVGPEDRPWFLALASRAMRHVLVDYAEARTASRRGRPPRLPLEAMQVAGDERATDFADIAASLEQLAGVDSHLSDIVNLRFFGGLSFDDIAAITGRPVPTVKRDWWRARAWLYRSLQQAADARA